MSEPQPNWERDVLQKLALAAVQEQRRSRHWSILFKSLGFLYLFIVLFLVAGWFGDDGVGIPKAHTALVDLQGVIASDQASADAVITSLQSAFEDKKTKGVVLRINSPGGSPVQAGQIYDEIRRLRKLHPQVPLYAVVDDICASGGYYVAVGADKIFVDKASIVGSIGVLMDGFGFTETMQKLGVERRLLTAGENKGFLDPFSPVNPEQQAYAKQMLEEIHGQFIATVREGRGKRLKETPDMFTGLVWSGERSIQLGLADEIGSLDTVARDVIKAEDIVDFTKEESLAERLAGRLGATMAKAMGLTDRAGVQLR
ncbi:protease [Thiobacillus denitrificans ATCC 25259]|uniref:Protease n=1 Tax=Thiobacillus denitrificans (strain ATCC 25259 / T1) TaxID=292415 RepID=Q3SIL5_THIDA|nr:S49 family peptidase [Thiobacillus denitrificans]AAZ97513.1 protease [Thiobacillus denitrificans ATCC 25259]